jgi:hypothetical protein
MKAIRTDGLALTTLQPEFLFTYGTGGIESPASLEVISLHQFYRKLLTKHQAETKALHELWEPWKFSTRQERFLQHRKIDSTFPFVVAGAVFDKEADLADEEDYHAGWRQLSGLVVLSFKYGVVKGDAERTADNRLLLQKQLLAAPLLGPSIVLIFKEPGECLINVLIAVGAIPDYWNRVKTITKYLQEACPKLYRKLSGAAPNANERYSVGADSLAWLRPRSAEGYVLFPVEQARAVTKECERKQTEEFARKRSNARKKR